MGAPVCLSGLSSGCTREEGRIIIRPYSSIVIIGVHMRERAPTRGAPTDSLENVVGATLVVALLSSARI
jgi:hypothetical protein